MPDEEYQFDLSNPVDVQLQAEKQRIESSPGWAERKAEIALRQGTGSSSPSDLNQPAQGDEHDRRNAAIKYNFETGKQATPTGQTPDYEAAKESFRESLGMAPGPDFDGHVANLHSWVNDSFSSADEFDRLAAAAEEVLGVKGAAELAIKLARAHARQKSRR